MFFFVLFFAIEPRNTRCILLHIQAVGKCVPGVYSGVCNNHTSAFFFFWSVSVSVSFLFFFFFVGGGVVLNHRQRRIETTLQQQ